MSYIAPTINKRDYMSKIFELEKEQPLLPVKLAAYYLRMAPKTVAKAVKAGQLDARTVGKRKYVLRDSLIKFLGK